MPLAASRPPRPRNRPRFPGRCGREAASGVRFSPPDSPCRKLTGLREPPSCESPMNNIRFIMLGGFLGAGKTTAMARLARHYMSQGKRVGLVTNDQAQDLVDT